MRKLIWVSLGIVGFGAFFWLIIWFFAIVHTSITRQERYVSTYETINKWGEVILSIHRSKETGAFYLLAKQITLPEVDSWGVSLELTSDLGGPLETITITSAGSDRRFGTKDDAIKDWKVRVPARLTGELPKMTSTDHN